MEPQKSDKKNTISFRNHWTIMSSAEISEVEAWILRKAKKEIQDHNYQPVDYKIEQASGWIKDKRKFFVIAQCYLKKSKTPKLAEIHVDYERQGNKRPKLTGFNIVDVTYNKTTGEWKRKQR